MSDKIRNLVNTVKLNGKLAEVKVTEGAIKDTGVPFISIEGAIQFGESAVETKKFKAFFSATTKDGKDSEQYKKAKEFAENAVDMKVNKDNPTLVLITGELKPNDYVDSKDELIESLRIDAKFFNDYSLNMDCNGTVDIEGYIHTIVEETKGEDKEPTGRLRVTLVSTDFFGNAVIVKNIIVPQDIKKEFEDLFEVGQTATFNLDFVPNVSEPKKKTGGIGKQRTTDGKAYLEMILVGTAGDPIDADDEKALSKETIKIVLSERKTKLVELKEKGYQSGGDKKTPVAKGGITKKPKADKPISDEDIPF